MADEQPAPALVLEVRSDRLDAALDRFEQLIVRLELAQGQVAAAGGELFSHAVSVRSDLTAAGEKLKEDARAQADELKAEVARHAEELKADLKQKG